MSFDYNSFDAFNEAMRKPQRPKKIKRVRRERSPKITIYSYLASRVPSDAHYVINKYGKYRRKMMLNASGNNNGAPSPTPAPTADNTDKIVGKINSNMLITGGFVIMAVALLIKYKK